MVGRQLTRNPPPRDFSSFGILLWINKERQHRIEVIGFQKSVLAAGAHPPCTDKSVIAIFAWKVVINPANATQFIEDEIVVKHLLDHDVAVSWIAKIQHGHTDVRWKIS